MSTALVRIPTRGAPPAIAARSHAPETRAAGPFTGTAGWSIIRGTQPTTFQGTGREVRAMGWERHPVVHACVRAISDIVAAIPLEVYRKDADGDTEVLPQHPALALLNAPRAALSAHALRARLATHFVTYGNAFWVLERPGPRRPPTAIRPISPEQILYAYVDYDTDTVVAWDWRDLQGRVHAKAPAEDIVQFKDLDAGDGLFGYPRGAAALLPLSTDTEASQFVRQVVTNHGVPGMVVLTEGVTDINELQRAEEAWHEKMVSRGERGRTKFVAGVKDVKSIGFDLSKLEFPDLRRVNREDICAAFAVDPRIIGISSAIKDAGLSGTQFHEARFRLIQQTVVPVMKAIESTLDVWFMPEWGDVYARFSPDEISELTEDIVETSTRVLAEMAAGARSREETREAIGLETDMDPTHTLVSATGSRVEYLVADQFAKAEQAKQAADAAAKALTDPPAPTDPAADPSAPPPARATARIAPSRVLLRGLTLTTEQRRSLWSVFDTRAAKAEQPYERAALLRFAAERESVGRAFAEASNGRAAGYDPFIFAALARIEQDYAPGGEYHAAWLDSYRALIAETIRSGGADVASTVGFDFSLENPRVQAVIRQRVTKLAGYVTETTLDSIRSAIATGRTAGMGIREIAQLVEETSFGAITKSRAMVIARTETIGAMNEGEMLAARESGVLHSKEWLTQGDDRVRDSHAALDGVRVDIASTFANGLQYPGDRSGAADEVIQCRCTLLFHDDEASAERSAIAAIERAVERGLLRGVRSAPPAAPAEPSVTRHVIHVTPDAEPVTPVEYRIVRDENERAIGIAPVIPSGAE